jgi:hypothetical protein
LAWHASEPSVKPQSVRLPGGPLHAAAGGGASACSASAPSAGITVGSTSVHSEVSRVSSSTDAEAVSARAEASRRAAIGAQPELAAGQTSLEQKIAILALMTLIFNRAGDERVLTFADIQGATGVDTDGVEYLVMKAVCIGVIDATIDEVAGTVAVTRVQPRVLTVDAVGVMASKLEKWCGVVKETLVMVEDASPELLA